MKPKSFSLKTISVVVLLVLALGAVGRIPVHATQTDPEAASPAGLGAEDWAQIQSLLYSSSSQQAYLKASNTDMDDQFGHSIAVSGNTVVVGAPYEHSNGSSESDNSKTDPGAAYVFILSGTTWSQQAYLKATYPDDNDNFGYSVAISGDTLVVGAPYEDSNASGVNGTENDNTRDGSGAAYVFTRSGTSWSKQAYLKASTPGDNDNFGWSVAIDGNLAVVGAYQEDSNSTGVGGVENNDLSTDSGAAYVFKRNETTWSQQEYLKASDTYAGDSFGFSVAISANTVVVGAYAEDSDDTGVNQAQDDFLAVGSGAAYIFNYSGTEWSQQASLKASNTGAGDEFGYSVSISGDTLVVGAPGEGSSDGNGGDNPPWDDYGAAYVFTRSGTNWSQQAYLKATYPNDHDNFGWSVAISGNMLVVGAYLEDSSATTVNGDQNNNMSTDSGAAYVFTYSTIWSQLFYLKVSNAETDDFFGYSVGISGDTVVGGAIREDSGATGVNGDGSGNSATYAGAGYIFHVNHDPTDIGLSNSTLSENQSAGTFVGTLSTTDENAGDTHGYSLNCLGADDDYFQISGSSLETKVVLNHEAKDTYHICVQTNDFNGGTYDKNFTINVTDVNDQPYDITLTSTSISENQPVSTEIGAPQTIDEDENETFSYDFNCTVHGADDASFQLYSWGLLLSNAVFDHETKETYAICIHTYNTTTGDTFDKNFTIHVTDVNESPTNISLSNNAVAENRPVGTTVGTLTTTDPDAGDTHTYNFACDDPGTDDTSFQISGNILKTNAVFDHETKAIYAICIRTDDGNGGTFDKNFTINITDVIEILKSTFRSVGIYDGHILETGEDSNVGGTRDYTSTTFNLGDEAGNKQYRAILSFNTGGLSDTAVITKVTLSIKRPATGFLTGNNNPFPWGLGLKVDVCRTFFGSSAALQLGDFNFNNATNCRLLVGTFGGTPTASWYSANILSTAFTRINKIGTTQFRLRFAKDDNNDNAADYLKFYSGNYTFAASRPTLVIEYYVP